ncbi:MAG: hypothetical protein MJZ32_12755 [Bacteroidaceae bacterium]|nr:hypothetical protein [Bacteroidaceae bacterium]
MDNAQIVTEVRNRVGQTNLSDQTITSLITPLIPKEGEPDENFFTTTANWLKTLGGNFSHDVATQVNQQVDIKANEKFEAFKKDFKPEAPKTMEELMKLLGVQQQSQNGPKTIEDLLKIISGQQQQQQNGNVSMEDVLKAIQASQKPDPQIAELTNKMNALLEENERIKNQNQFESVVKAVTDMADELNISDTALWNHAIEVVSGSIERKDITSDKLLEQAKAKFEELTKILRPAGTKPYGDTNHGGGNGLLASILKERSDAQEAKAKARAAFLNGAK